MDCKREFGWNTKEVAATRCVNEECIERDTADGIQIELLTPTPKTVAKEQSTPTEVKAEIKPRKEKTVNEYSISEEEERELAELMDSD